jgi:hypothetical protein
VNPAKRKKIYRLSLQQKREEVVPEEVRVLPTVPVIESEPVAEVKVEEVVPVAEEPVVEEQPAAPEVKASTKRTKKVVEPVSE